MAALLVGRSQSRQNSWRRSVQDEPSTSDDKSEPPRPRSIPDDFIWDPELQAWYPELAGPGEVWDAEAWQRNFEEVLRRAQDSPGGSISVHELRAACTLNVSPAGRTSHRRKKPPRGQRELFSDFVQDGTALPEKQPPAPPDSDATYPRNNFHDCRKLNQQASSGLGHGKTATQPIERFSSQDASPLPQGTPRWPGVWLADLVKRATSPFRPRLSQRRRTSGAA